MIGEFQKVFTSTKFLLNKLKKNKNSCYNEIKKLTIINYK